MLVVEAWGTRVRIEADEPGWLEEARGLFLPGWRPADSAEGASLLQVRRTDGGRVRLSWEDELDATVASDEDRLRTLENWLHLAVAARSPEALFLHAGAVVHEGRGIVLPATSWSGKSTLVHALVQAGATYYSDEFAVLDDDGRLHPYPVALSRRDAGPAPAESLGWRPGLPPVPVGLVVLSRYQPDGPEDAFEVAPPGEAAMEILTHAVSARAFPERALRTLSRVVATATCLRGPRGEAEATARRLLASTSAPRPGFPAGPGRPSGPRP